jgi:hypothetical protein
MLLIQNAGDPQLNIRKHKRKLKGLLAQPEKKLTTKNKKPFLEQISTEEEQKETRIKRLKFYFLSIANARNNPAKRTLSWPKNEHYILENGSALLNATPEAT